MVPSVVSLNAVISDMAPMLRRVIGEDIDLALGLAGDVGSVRVDQGQIEQVILNLVANARDAMPDGGTLTIETRAVPGDAFQPATALLLIHDTGVGMDLATCARIFEPFFTTKEAGQGTGLGLATVHGIVKESGGAIEVRSEPGAGSTFEIQLPLADEPASNTAPRPAAAARRGSETILLVEDDAAIRLLATRILRMTGYTVLTAKDGEEAVRALAGAKGPVQLLLTDVVMPGMNGRVLADRLSEIDPRIRVLYTSGYTDEGVLRLRGDETTHFVGKPYTPAVLQQRVREVLDA